MHDIQIELRPHRPLRIAVVTETWPPEVNGVARTVHLMVAGLLARGHQVQLLRPRQAMDGTLSMGPFSGPAADRNPGNAVPDTGVDGRMTQHLMRPLRVPGYPGLQLGLAMPAQLRRLWRHSPPDLVHIVTEGPLGWAATIAARQAGIPLCSDFHTNFHAYSRHYGMRLLASPVAAALRLLHNLCDCTLVPTGEMRRDLAELGFQRLAIVGRGIDTGLFSPHRRSAALRASWGCGPQDPVILCVSRMAAEKNLELFATAAGAIRREMPAARIVMVGDGPALAGLRALHPGIVFAGMREGEDLAAHYASGDLFLFPSITETFGNVTLEAMASGLAVLAYDYAAAREYIVDGITGVLAPFDDAEAFVTRALWMARSPACLPKMRRRARQQAEALSWQRVFDDLEQVLLAVAERAPKLPVGPVMAAQRA